jgi:carbonic anhydrase
MNEVTTKIPADRTKLDDLLEYNQRWSDNIIKEDPTFFIRMKQGQTPSVLWIGCSDSRVPPSVITGADPGVLFMYRNIANLAVHTDPSFLSVLEYAVLVLKVPDIVVAGHYNCGGVHAACSNDSHTHDMIDHWVHHIRDIKRMYGRELAEIENNQERFDRLVEYNVIEQVRNITDTSTIRKARRDGSKIRIHGLVYDTGNGKLNRLIEG